MTISWHQSLIFFFKNLMSSLKFFIFSATSIKCCSLDFIYSESGWHLVFFTFFTTNIFFINLNKKKKRKKARRRILNLRGRVSYEKYSQICAPELWRKEIIYAQKYPSIIFDSKILYFFYSKISFTLIELPNTPLEKRLSHVQPMSVSHLRKSAKTTLELFKIK